MDGRDQAGVGSAPAEGLDGASPLNLNCLSATPGGRFVILAFAVSALSHLLLGAQRLVFLDRIFLPDDTYYVLAIARNLAHGFGPSTDGVIATSGFQPLIAFLLAPIFWVTSNSDIPVYCAVALSGLFGILNCGLVGFIVFKAARSANAAALAILWMAVCPILLRSDLNGLETSLAAFLAMLTVLLMGGAGQDDSGWRAAAIGVCAGLALLARIDNLCIVALVLSWAVVKLGLRRAGLALLTAAIVVLPWWLYCFTHFGKVIPESGAAVRQIVEYYQANQVAPTAVSFKLGVAALSQVSGAGIGIRYWPWALPALVFLLVAIGRSIWCRRIDERGLLAVTAITFFSFYTFYLPAYWFFDRYFYLVYLSIVICTVSLSANWTRRRRHAKRWSMMGASAVLLMVMVSIPQLVKYRSSPAASMEDARGYREIAQQVIAHLPNGTTVGAMQSGALCYYTERAVRVVNLDGVVNGDAFRAIRDKRMAAYLKATGVEYFADWDLNVRYLGWARGSSPSLSLYPVGRVRTAQGAQHFTVYRVVTE